MQACLNAAVQCKLAYSWQDVRQCRVVRPLATSLTAFMVIRFQAELGCDSSLSPAQVTTGTKARQKAQTAGQLVEVFMRHVHFQNCFQWCGYTRKISHHTKYLQTASPDTTVGWMGDGKHLQYNPPHTLLVTQVFWPTMLCTRICAVNCLCWGWLGSYITT